MIWAAGVIASPAAKWLDAAHDRAGRIMVTPELTVPVQPDIFAIGDTVAVTGDGSARCPASRPPPSRWAPMSAGRSTRGSAAARPATRSAIATRATSPPSAARRRWPIWAGSSSRAFRPGCCGPLAHVWFLIGWRNRFVVALNWMWSYVTFERGARLITGAAQESQARGAARQPYAGATLRTARTGMMLEDKLEPTPRRAARAVSDPADRESPPARRRAAADAAAGRAGPRRRRPAARVRAARHRGMPVSSEALLARGPAGCASSCAARGAPTAHWRCRRWKRPRPRSSSRARHWW